MSDWKLCDSVDRLNESKVLKLKSLRDDVDFYNEKDKLAFFRSFNSLFGEWKGQLPNLLDFFHHKEIDWLLSQAITKKNRGAEYHEGRRFIDFVVDSGYRHEPSCNEHDESSTTNKQQTKQTNNKQTTALHRAARLIMGHHELNHVAGQLFQIYQESNYTDEFGFTHFHVACTAGCYDIVERYLDRGADINCVVETTGNSPLHLAVSSNRRQVTSLLLRRGANPSLANAQGLTPLHRASKHCLEDTWFARMLFGIYRDMSEPLQGDAQDYCGNSALHLAMSRGHKNLSEFLLRNGASPNLANAEGSTPVHLICKMHRSSALMEVLFEMSDLRNEEVKIDAQDNDGNTPLHVALRCNNIKIVELLLVRGADPNKANNEESTPLHIISKDLQDSNHNLAKTFFKVNKRLNKAVMVDAVDQLNRTPLQYAVARFLPKIVDVLLNNGADLSNFVFPEESYLGEHLEGYKSKEYWSNETQLKLRLAAGPFPVIERLGMKGYELERSEVMKIMKLYAKHGLFQDSADLQEPWRNDEDFAREANGIMLNATLSLNDFVHLRPKEAGKLITFQEYLQIACSINLKLLPEKHREACALHLCETLSRGFFRRWALDPFWRQIHYRLPAEMCELILEELTNKDLYNICLATPWPARYQASMKNVPINLVKLNTKKTVRAKKALKRLQH